MPSPLSEAFAETLKTNATAALAALMVIADAHREIFAWASRMIGVEPTPQLRPKPRAKRKNGDRRFTNASKTNGHREPRGNGADLRTVKRDADDGKLLEAMRENPEGTIGDLAREISKSKTSVVTALARLRDAGLVVNEDRKWALAAPRELTPKWVEPLKAKDRAAHAHLNAAS